MEIASTQELNFMFTKSLIKKRLAELESIEKDKRQEHQAIEFETLKRDLVILENIQTDVMWDFYTGKKITDVEFQSKEAGFYCMNNKLMNQMIKEHNKYSQLVDFLGAIANEDDMGGD